MRKITPAMVAAYILTAWLLFGDGIRLPFVEPPPFKADTLCVLVVEETTARNSYTAGQREAMTSTAGPGSIREYVGNRHGQYRLLDKDADLSRSEPWVQEAMKAAQPNLLPWIVTATPTQGFSRQLPATAAETVSALKKIGGE